MANVEIKITNELLEELNKHRFESPVLQDVFDGIKTSLADQETEICELQSYIYDIETAALDEIIEEENNSYSIESEDNSDDNLEESK